MTTTQLRPYQLEALAKMQHRHVTVLPTGTGKTAVFCEHARRHLEADSHHRVGILVHRQELIEQTETALRKAGVLARIGVVQGSRREWRRPVTIMMQQTARNLDRLVAAELPGITALVVDEAHRYTTELSGVQLLAHFEDQGAQVYGFTATPVINGEEIFGPGKPFVGISYRRTIVGMIREGYLCDARALTLQLGMDLRRVKVQQGDYVASQLGREMVKAHAPERIVEAWLKHASGRRRTICFTPTVEFGQMLESAFRTAGASVAQVYGNTPKAARESIVRQFRHGEVSVLVNVVVGAEGFDVPEVDCVVQARPTKSWTLYTQMVGRGLRPAPGKADLLVLDVVGSSDHHDLEMFPKAIGLRDMKGKFSVLQTLERGPRERRGATERELELHDERIELTETLLYSRIPWTMYGPEHLAPCDEEEILVLTEEAGVWYAYRHWIDSGAEQEIAHDESASVVQEAAEDYIRQKGTSEFTQRRRSWRDTAPTDAQRRMLRRAKWTVPDTRGAASDAITRLRYATNRAREAQR